MPRLMTCPRCAKTLDVAGFSAGADVTCYGCRAVVPIPLAVEEAAAPAAPAARGPAPGRQTTLFRKMSKARNTGRSGVTTFEAPRSRLPMPLIAGGGVLALILALAAFAGSRKSEGPSKAPAPRPSRAAARAEEPPPPPPPPARVVVPSTSVPSDRGWWDRTMEDLRPAGGFEDSGKPAGAAFARLKAMGKGAYAPLAGYVGHEDVGLGRAAVAALMELTGKVTRLPNEANRGEIAKEWEAWIAGQ